MANLLLSVVFCLGFSAVSSALELPTGAGSSGENIYAYDAHLLFHYCESLLREDLHKQDFEDRLQVIRTERSMPDPEFMRAKFRGLLAEEYKDMEPPLIRWVERQLPTQTTHVEVEHAARAAARMFGDQHPFQVFNQRPEVAIDRTAINGTWARQVFVDAAQWFQARRSDPRNKLPSVLVLRGQISAGKTLVAQALTRYLFPLSRSAVFTHGSETSAPLRFNSPVYDDRTDFRFPLDIAIRYLLHGGALHLDLGSSRTDFMEPKEAVKFPQIGDRVKTFKQEINNITEAALMHSLGRDGARNLLFIIEAHPQDELRLEDLSPELQSSVLVISLDAFPRSGDDGSRLR